MVNQEFIANEVVLSSAANPVVEGEHDARSDDEDMAGASASRALRSATPKQPKSNQPVTPAAAPAPRSAPTPLSAGPSLEGVQTYKRQKSVAYVKTVTSPASLEPIVRSDLREGIKMI